MAGVGREQDVDDGRLGRFVERLCEREHAAEVDLVCHSMGGLVALLALALACLLGPRDASAQRSR